MRPMRLKGVPILLAIVVLLALAPAPAGAITLQRAWHAKLSSGTYGVATIKAYTNGVGSFAWAYKNLRHNVTYSVQIRKGTCSSLGSTVLNLRSVRTSTAGTASGSSILYSGQMAALWPAARGTSFVVRIVNGTSSRCGAFTFNHATRIVISSLGINLPIVRGPSGYPYCHVAMYQSLTAQPREPGITFIYAHARTGMFLPLLTKFKASGAAGLLGRVVKVYTSDSVVSYYKIDRVRKTSAATTMNGVFDMSRERLWLQTSTGPELHLPEAHRRGPPLRVGQDDVRGLAPDASHRPLHVGRPFGRASVARSPSRYPPGERGERHDDEARGVATVRRGRDR